MPSTVYATPVSFLSRLRWALSCVPQRLRDKLVRLLMQCVLKLAGDSNLLAHARRELPSDSGDEMQREMNRCLLQIIAVFALQGHTGFTGPYAVATLEKLMQFEPLGPLTGADDEWVDHGYCMQNKRCGHVFKRDDRFGGQPYDMEGRIFRDPSGSCYTSRDSAVPITFPYTPKREYVDVPA